MTNTPRPTWATASASSSTSSPTSSMKPAGHACCTWCARVTNNAANTAGNNAASKAIRWGALTAAALALAALVLPPFINVGRYKGRVIESMSNALGRPVTVDAVELRLLPQPGFYLDNVSVGDD